MPEVTTCPQCRRRIRMPESALGRRVKCPGCGAPFVAGEEKLAPVTVVPESLPYVEPESESDVPTVEPEPVVPVEPTPPAPAAAPPPAPAGEPDLEAWAGVRNGIALQGLAHVLYTLAVVTMMLVTFVAAVSKGEGPGKAGTTFLMLLGGFAVFSFVCNQVMSVVGQCCCLFAPARPATRAWAVACLALAALAVAQEGGILRLSGTDRLGDENLAAFAGVFLFLEVGRLTVLPLFLRGLGAELKNPGVAAGATYLAIGTPALFLLNFMISFFWHAVVRPNADSHTTYPPGFGPSRDFDWVGLLLLVFNLLSLIAALLAGVFIMFRAWQALGPKPAVVSRRSLA